MKSRLLPLFPAEKPWATAVEPRRAVAAMMLIFGTTICVKFLPRELTEVWRSAICASLETAGMLAAWLLVLPPGSSGGGLCGIFGAEPLKCRHFRWIVAAPLLIWSVNAALGAVWIALLRRLGIPFEEMQKLIAEVRNFSSGEFLLVMLAVGVMTPMAEEFFFRRLLYGVLEPLGPRRAALTTSLLFAAAHGFLVGFPGFLWMGLVFQLVYCRCRNLGAPILVHAAINCVALAGARAGWLT